MTGRLASLRDRPVAERERRTAITAVAALLSASTILLAVTQSAARSHHPVSRSSSMAARASRGSIPAGDAAAPLAPGAARVARGFLAGYLAYLYGRNSANSITGATPALARSLRAHPPLVPPAMRARRPRILSLHTTPAPDGLVGVSALINDGELASYSLGLLLTPGNGRLLVSSVQGTR